MPLVKCGPDTSINPKLVSTIEWDRGHSYTAMVVTMATGHVVRLRQEPHLMDGTDCYLIEAKLLEGAHRPETG